MDTDTPAELTAHLGYWLRYVSNHVSHAFAQRLAKRGVTVSEWVVLRELHREEAMAPSALARRLGLTRGAISKLADRLVRKQLVARSDSAEDGRAQSLALTAAGRALVPALAALADENDAAFFGDLNPDERAALERILRGIVDRRGLRRVPIS